MSKKKIVISPAGGISPGAPFVLGQGLIVQQVTPAFAQSARFGQLPDAFRSFIAPGPGTGANTLVLGDGSSQQGTSNAVLLGRNLTAHAGAASLVVLVGDTIDASVGAPLQGDIVAVGANITILTNSGSSVFIGTSVTTTSAASHTGTVLVGNQATSSAGFSVGVGLLASAGSESVAVGKSANAQTLAVAVGTTAIAGVRGVSIGRTAGALGPGDQTVLIGYAAVGTAISGISIGYASFGSHTGAIVIGDSATSIEANSFLVGGSVAGNWVSTFRPGPDSPDAAYPGLSVVLPNAVAGADKAAPNTTFLGGRPTGNSAVGGEIRFQTAVTVAGSSSIRQAEAERFALVPSTGAAGAAIVRFSNYTNGAAAQAGTLLNAPVAGNPNTWIPIIDGTGAVRHIPAW